MVTMMHEHITIDLSKQKGDPDCRLDCFEQSLSQLKELHRQGVGRIVDVTNLGMGRDAAYVERMARESGLEIFSSTGAYKEPFLPKVIYHSGVQEIAEWMIAEIEEGIDGKYPARMIGEIGTGKGTVSVQEKKLFEASALVAKRTRTPVYTHTTLGTLALEQAEFFRSKGLDLSRVVIGHLDLSGDLAYICAVLDTGVTVGFDTVGKEKYLPDWKRVELLYQLEQRGRLNQIVLSMDITRKSHLQLGGGAGYTYFTSVFLPMLREKGLREESLYTMLEENPRRILGD